MAMDEPFEKLRDLNRGKTFLDRNTGQSAAENKASWWNVIRTRIFCLHLNFTGNKKLKDKLKKFKNPVGTTNTNPASSRKTRKRKRRKPSHDNVPPEQPEAPTPTPEKTASEESFIVIPSILDVSTIFQQVRERENETNMARTCQPPPPESTLKAPAPIKRAGPLHGPVNSLPELMDNKDIVVASSEDLHSSDVESWLSMKERKEKQRFTRATKTSHSLIG